MSISFDILGEPGRDNALFVRIDSGQSVDRLLFDCGDGCLSSIPFAEVAMIDQLFLSHLHMDHIGGFDYFFRCVFNRDTKPNVIWGPPGTGQILHHRFRGFLWNLHAEMDATWRVVDIDSDQLVTTRFELSEAFANAYPEDSNPRESLLIDGANYSVEALTMDHGTPTIAYVVREKPRSNIDTSRLQELGLRPGPWMKQLKDTKDLTGSIAIDGVDRDLAKLRDTLVVETAGDSIAYLTDFLLEQDSIDQLAWALAGCKTVVCEAQYRHSDLELARRNYHMTTVLSARLAAQAKIDNLVLFHLSDRYDQAEWAEMLAEARAGFSNTSYPDHWDILP